MRQWWVCLDYVSFDNGNSSSTKPTTATEPTTKPTQATAPATKPTEPVVTPTQPTTPAPTQPAHVHTWTTVHHDKVGHYEDVVIKAAYDEQVGKGQEVFNECGARFEDATSVVMHIFRTAPFQFIRVPSPLPAPSVHPGRRNTWAPRPSPAEFCQCNSG